MEEFNTIEKVEEYLKKANCYGEYNYFFTVQPGDTISDAILMCFGAIGGAIAGLRKSKGVIGYILNKNEKGIGIIPIEMVDKKQNVVIDKTIFLKNEDIDKVSIK